MNILWQDLRYGARMLMKQPGFTLIAVLTLALGIGANTAIFSVVNGVLLRPLPFSEPERLVMIRETKLPQFPEFSVSPGNFLDWQKQNTVFERVVALTPSVNILTSAGEPDRLRGVRVTDGFFTTLGVTPQLGRSFLPEEDQPGRNNVVILSHGFWQRRFGGSTDIVNQTVTLDGQSFTVVGVMPSAFYFMNRDNELWLPMGFTAQEAQNHGGHSLAVFGRLKSGVTLARAHTEMSAIATRLAAQYPEVNTGWNVKLMPLLEFMVRGIAPALLALLAAVAFVLLIACVNVANLLLTRAAGRQKELAIRAALGAARARIVRQLLTESLLLALAGGALGLLLARWGVDALLALTPPDLPRLGEVALDGRVLMFTLVAALLTGLLFGLIPAWQASRPNLHETMKDGGRGSTEGRQFTRSALIVLEVAAALVLLVGSGLMMKSFWRLLQVDPGFRPENALAVSVELPDKKYAKEDQQAAFFQRLIEQVRTLPGVQSVGATSNLPLNSADFVLGFEVKEQAPLSPGVGQSTNFYAVSADYFKAMGISLLRGRGFTERDNADAPKVAVINEAMANKLFPNQEAIGQHITFDRRNNNLAWFEIVGIVRDVKEYGLNQQTPLQTYEPYLQQTLPAMTMVVRTAADPTNLSAAIRNEVRQLDAAQPISDIKTLNQIVSTSIGSQQFVVLLLGLFSVVALLLAALGIYGVLSYAVTRRTHEIGIRLALGASARDVLRLVIGQGMKLAGIGVMVGLVAAYALTRWMETLLFQVKATDPLTFAAIAALLTLVALLACWIPARRAAKVDPMIALRCE